MGQRDLHEWDEARNGVNAFEMLENGDFINLHYNGQQDTWNAKPPLMIWLVAAGYKIFGFNEFALRFPSFLGVVLSLVFFFRLLRLFENNLFTFTCSFAFISCGALIGWHVGLNGDFDALLVFALTASSFYFIRYAEFGDQKALYAVALFTGLAFYIKGTAAFVLLPGFLLYLIVAGKAVYTLKNYRSWSAAFILLLIVSSWVLLVYFFGKKADSSFYGSNNLIETLLIHDTFHRLANTDFGADKNVSSDPFYFFNVLDVRLRLLSYLFYAAVLAGLWQLFINRKQLHNYIQFQANRLVIFSICCSLPLTLLISLAKHTNNWYMAPVLPYILYLAVKGAFFWAEKWRPLYPAFLLVLLLSFFLHYKVISSSSREFHRTFSNGNPIFAGNQVVITNFEQQDILLYLKWMKKDIVRTEDINLHHHRDELFLLRYGDESKIIREIGEQHCAKHICLVKLAF